METLEVFWESQGKPLEAHPSIGEDVIDLFLLSKELTKRGGPDKVHFRFWGGSPRSPLSDLTRIPFFLLGDGDESVARDRQAPWVW